MLDQGAQGWRKARASADKDECVEVGEIPTGVEVVAVRDTKAGGTGPVLGFTAAAWTEFIGELKNDRFAV